MDRYEELEKVIDALDSIYNILKSKDIKSDILDLTYKYETEKQDLESKLNNQVKEDEEYLNKEYMKNAI